MFSISFQIQAILEELAPEQQHQLLEFAQFLQHKQSSSPQDRSTPFHPGAEPNLDTASVNLGRTPRTASQPGQENSRRSTSFYTAAEAYIGSLELGPADLSTNPAHRAGLGEL